MENDLRYAEGFGKASNLKINNSKIFNFDFLTLNFDRRGMIITYVLVFGAIFLLMLSGLLGYILLQLRQSAQKLSWNEALNIAEAGIEYYRWCANNGVEAGCSGERDYFDGNGVLVGKFSIDSTSSSSCGQTTQRQIISTGWTAQFPSVQRKVKIIYGRESVAKYSYILNSSVWIGGDHAISGPYHSNGGIRMDGQNQSLMTSAAILNGVAEWVCSNSFGCCRRIYFGYPYYDYGYDCALDCPLSCRVNAKGTILAEGVPIKNECICPGIFTTTSNPTPSLFKFPVPPFSFDMITMDLADIKYKAKTGGGIYFPVSTQIVPGSKGYHLNFKSNGTVEVWVVMALQQTDGYSDEDGWKQDRFTINNESLYGTYPIPAACSAIYMEDNLWVTGTVKGKVVVASAHLKEDGDTNPDVDTDVVFPDSITYSNYGGSDGLAIIAERNALIGPQSPDSMELHAIVIAQKGRFGRNHYPDNFKNVLNIYGSIISKGRVGT
ncbi:MAG: hypothetical protein WCX69_05515, partial [Candidatus Paceibacterota bacterium]